MAFSGGYDLDADFAGGDAGFTARGRSLEELFASCGDAVLAVMTSDPRSVLPEHRSSLSLESVSLGSRILVVLLTGLCLARTTSARQMGRAMTGIMRPVLGARAWLPALALSLMIHFLPMTLATLRQTGQTVKVRCPGMSLHRRMVLLATASLRSLSRKTWNQTIA
ncbi:MAG: archease, partial [Spirochaetota bacterium]